MAIYSTIIIEEIYDEENNLVSYKTEWKEEPDNPNRIAISLEALRIFDNNLVQIIGRYITVDDYKLSVIKWDDEIQALICERVWV